MNSPERTSHTDNDLDRILLEQEVLLPTSGFAASVTDAIQQEAAAPAPIPFPWKWALPGIAAIVTGVVILCRLAVNTFESMQQSLPAGADWWTWLHSSAPSAILLRTQIAPVALALAISFACVVLSSKWATGWSAR
jgi:hypothetical protein